MLTKLLSLPVPLVWGRNGGANAPKNWLNADYWYGVTCGKHHV